MSTFRIKRGDLTPAFRATLYANGTVYPLEPDAAVRFLMAGPLRRRTDKRVTGEATIIDADNGVVEYEPVDGDTDLVGDFAAEWEVTPNGGDPVTFPDDGYDRVVIAYDLDTP